MSGLARPLRARAVAALSILLAGGLAGCVADTVDPGEMAPATERDRLLAYLESIPEPVFDRTAAVDWWEDYVTTYIKRDNGFPNNEPAAQAIADEMTATGFDTRILAYDPLDYQVTAIPPIRVVEAIRPGVGNASSYVALISHYDTQTNTIQGAYDDGSGVAAMLSICKLLALVETNKTIACLYFDAEERGLLGSRVYVDDKIINGDEDFEFVQGFGYDMVGLNWPGYSTWKLYAMAGLDTDDLIAYMPDHLAFMDVALYDFLGRKLNVTEDGVALIDVHDRNSDEQNFKRAGVPVVRFAGGRHAADYPEYHRPMDTADYVYEFAGGRENFEKGYEMVVLVSYYTILAYDRYDPKALPDVGR